MESMFQYKGVFMKLLEAVNTRIKEYLKSKNMTQYELFKKSGVSQSTITTLLKSKNKSTQINTIYFICQGLNVELNEFFNSPLFNSENIED